MALNRDDAWKLLCEYTQNENLRKHALAVESCVRGYARKLGRGRRSLGSDGAAARFRLRALAERRTSRHAGTSLLKARSILRGLGYPEEMIHAILAHADYTGVKRESPLGPTLFACDELAGFLTACALIKPTKTIFDVETESVVRKLKDKAFARGVNREDVRQGADELGIPLTEHIGFCIECMRAAAPQLGLERKAGA